MGWEGRLNVSAKNVVTLSIVRNERTEEREGRDGRVRSKRVVTYDVVRNGELLAECRTLREARQRFDELFR